MFLGAAFVPTWLVIVSWIALAIAFACAAWILYDIFGRGYRQHMWIMEAVWPITALYFGPVAVWAYYRWGRPQSHKWMEEYGEPKGKRFSATTATLCAGGSGSPTMGTVA